MRENTPYTPPVANVADANSQQYAELKMFSPGPRIGRLRYLAYSFGMSFLIMIVMSVVGGIATAILSNALADAAMPIFIAIYSFFYIVIFVVSIIFSVKRLHDLNQTGWLSIFMFIPIIGFFFYLYLLFASGSDEANRFGNPPPPNSTGVIVTAWLVPLVMIAYIGVIAAIAIPAYNGYIQKAQEMQMQQ